MIEYTPELIGKARLAKTAEELVKTAKENGIIISFEDAEVIFQKLHPQERELDDDELESAAGGGCSSPEEKTCTTFMSDGCPTFWTMK